MVPLNTSFEWSGKFKQRQPFQENGWCIFPIKAVKQSGRTKWLWKNSYWKRSALNPTFYWDKLLGLNRAAWYYTASFTQADYVSPCSPANKEHGSITKETKKDKHQNLEAGSYRSTAHLHAELGADHLNKEFWYFHGKGYKTLLKISECSVSFSCRK